MSNQLPATRVPLLPLSALSSGLIAVLIGFGGTVALIVQAEQQVGGSPEQIVSAVTALCLGIGIGSGILSLWRRMPIVLAWSTPGAALIATNTLSISYPVAVSVFMAAAVLMMFLGLIPALGKMAGRIPTSVAAAMLAGVLLPFCMGLFRTFQSDALLAGVLLIIFILARQRFPASALLIVLVAAIGVVVARGEVTLGTGPFFGTLHPVAPVLDWKAIISLGVPLFLVTLVSQNLPGFVVLRSSGYVPPTQLILLSTGIASLLTAPLGAHSVNLGAITAAICTGEDAHPDSSRRYVVGLVYAVGYLLLSVFSASLVGLFTKMPPGTVAAIAGVALIGPLTNALGAMLSVPEQRESAVLTFAATASGITLFGIGSAFWGLLVGFLVMAVRRFFARAAIGTAA
ncbi:benzoate/H(+) symporter BenE family transporter [Verrucomicrobiota bacterium sgz303538]